MRRGERERPALRASFIDTLGFVRYQRGEFAEAVPVRREAVELAGDVQEARKVLRDLGG
jgi:hypothetical protein